MPPTAPGPILRRRRLGTDLRRLRDFPVMTEQQRGFAELEAGCSEISEYNPVLVPELLQTPGYARHRIISAALVAEQAGDPEGGEDQENQVRARQARQSLLTRPDAPRYTAVLEEAALGRRAGPPEVLHEQLVHLCELAMLPNVTLHLLLRDASDTLSWLIEASGRADPAVEPTVAYGPATAPAQRHRGSGRLTTDR